MGSSLFSSACCEPVFEHVASDGPTESRASQRAPGVSQVQVVVACAVLSRCGGCRTKLTFQVRLSCSGAAHACASAADPCLCPCSRFVVARMHWVWRVGFFLVFEAMRIQLPVVAIPHFLPSRRPHFLVPLGTALPFLSETALPFSPGDRIATQPGNRIATCFSKPPQTSAIRHGFPKNKSFPPAPPPWDSNPDPGPSWAGGCLPHP